MSSTSAKRSRFHQLHQHGELFVMPNPWDVGSARILAALGFPAVATTSSGFANSVGLDDGDVSLDQLAEHVAAMAAAVAVPVSVDAERCFADDLDGVAETVAVLAEAGASGCSIEDWDPATQSIDSTAGATARVASAADAADNAGMVLTARAENQLRGIDDLEDTIHRLCSYRDAGAHCLYAPGLVEPADIARVVQEVGAPVNVLALPAGPSISDLAELGVRRVSTGGALARTAYGALVSGARELLDAGTSTYAAAAPPGRVVADLLQQGATGRLS